MERKKESAKKSLRVFRLFFAISILFLGQQLPIASSENYISKLYSNVVENARGANVPWIEYEAEQGRTNGVILGPSRTYYTKEAEASGRMAVKLDSTGKYVEFVSRSDANSIVVRYCMPDADTGGGIKASLSLYINNKHLQDLALTSRFAWIYGNFPWTNKPSAGKAHRFFDESHAIIGNIEKGDTIRLQKDESDKAAYYIIDLIDLESIPSPIEMPSNAISITNFGATANDGSDDTKAIIDCINDAKTKNKIVWIPAGTFNMNSDRISLENVTIKGAGMWYSILTGLYAQFEGQGSNCKVSDLAIFGETDHRIDESPDNAFNGYFGKGSEFRNLWVEHEKCGFWIANYKSLTDITDGMVISGCRIRNTMADGVNYARGTSNSIVELTHLRNTGDDALATWSQDSIACHNIIFRYNTVQLPWLANCIAIYGGIDNKVENNLLYDGVYVCGGVNISSNFRPAPFGGTTSVTGNTIVRCGTESYVSPNIGAIWIYCKDSNIDSKLIVKDNNIYDATYSGISVHGPMLLNDAVFSNNIIDGAGTCGIDIKTDAMGSATVSGNSIKNTNSGNFCDQTSKSFRLK